SHHGSVDSFLGTLTETPCKGVDTLTKSLDSSKDSIKKSKNPFKWTSLGRLNSSDRSSKKKTTKTHKRAFSDTVAERNHADFTNNLYTNDQIMKTKDNILTEGVTTRPNSACNCRNGVILIDQVESQQEGLSNVKLSDEKLAQELSHEQKRKMQLKKTLSLDGNLMLLKRGMKLLWKLPKAVS
uniref:Uncharacterized protein n=1 Tax=Clytia hemisphaerica TaxID=252671 RepID=A0A7M5WLE5_9CNID